MSSNLLIAMIGIMFMFSFASVMAMAVIIVSVIRPKEPKKAPAVKEITEADERARRAAQRLHKEVSNMLTYNGDPQEEIHID